MNRRVFFALGAAALLPRLARAQPRYPGCTFLNLYKKVLYPGDINKDGFPFGALGHSRADCIKEPGGGVIRIHDNEEPLPPYETRGRDKWIVLDSLEKDARSIFLDLISQGGIFSYHNYDKFNSDMIIKMREDFKNRYLERDREFQLTDILVTKRFWNPDIFSQFSEITFHDFDDAFYRRARTVIYDSTKFIDQGNNFIFGFDRTLDSLLWYSEREHPGIEPCFDGVRIRSGLASVVRNNIIAAVFNG